MNQIRTFYLPDEYPYWIPWKQFHNLEMIGKPGDLDAGGKPLARAGFAPRVSLGKPANSCDTTTGRNLRRGFTFQVKFEGSGHVVISRFRIHAQRQIEKSTSLNKGTLQK